MSGSGCGQGVFAATSRLDVTVGALKLNKGRRHSVVVLADSRRRTQFSNARRLSSGGVSDTAGQTLFAALSRGFRAGGFNPRRPLAASHRREAWNVKGSAKTTFAGGKATPRRPRSGNWNDLQLNLPNPSVPGQFYIATSAQRRRHRARPHGATAC
jgi:hypothetical protein